MIEINEHFTVDAPPDQVYAVLSDPHAVVECVQGAELGEQNDDGTFPGKMTVKFSALRVSFAGKVRLDLEQESRRGTMHASGRDGQGGTKFQADATFEVEPANGGASSAVTATGEVALAGKLASVIENAATAVVRRMTGEFVEALSVRCASGSTQLGPASAAAPAAPTEATAGTTAAAVPPPAAVPPAGVLLLHDLGGSPAVLRGWGEALAAADLAVTIPRLPGHGTRWKDLARSTAGEWFDAASQALSALRADHARVYVMGLGLGATLALRLAAERPADVAGVVAVNPIVTAPLGTPKPLALMRFLRRSVPAHRDDVKRPGATVVGYDRLPLRAAVQTVAFGSQTLGVLGRIDSPVLVVSSTTDHVAAPTDSTAVLSAVPVALRRQLSLDDSYHVVPLDADADRLARESVEFVTTEAMAVHS